MKGIKPIFLTGILAFGGCTTPPSDQSGALLLSLPETWTAQPEMVSSLFEGGWLSDFNDPVLPHLVAEALTDNYDIQTAAARLESARAGAIVAGADRWPEMVGSIDGSRQQLTATRGFALTNNRVNSFNLGLALSWEVDLWGRLRNHHRAAIADWQAQEEDFRAARLSLAAQTAKVWFDAIESELQVRLAEETLKSFISNLETVEERFRIGINRALDLRLTRANVAAARSALEARKRQRDVTVRSFEVLLGRYPSYQLDVAEKLPEIIRPVPAGLPSEMLSRRPDLIAAERRLAASDERVKEAKKSLLPKLALTGGGGTSSDELHELLNTDFKVWNIAAGLTQPLFQGRRLTANVKRSRADREQALTNYAQTALTAFREVESALAAETYLVQEETALRTAVEEAIGAEGLAWDQYQAGLDGIITVLESQRRSFDSQRQLLQITNQRLQNRMDLYLALGGDFGMPKKEAKFVVADPTSHEAEAL